MKVTIGRLVILIGVLATGVASYAATAPGAGEQGDVVDLASKIKQTKESIVESETERRRLLGSIYAINQRMKKIASDKGRLTDELIQAQDSVNTVAGIIRNLEEQISKQRETLRKRLRALYKLSGESYIGVIFSTTNAYELDSTLRNLRIVSDGDYNVIKSYRQNLKTLAQQRARLKSQVERLLTLERRVRKQETLLTQEHKAKSDLAQQFETTTRQKLLEMKQLRQRSSQLTRSALEGQMEQQLAKLLQPSIFEKKGSLAAPVGNGSIAREFGLVIDPEYKFKMSHKGWQIRVSPMTAVVSIDDGKIAFADTLEGYGKTIIVDHGDHYYSLYAGLDEVTVQIGATVRAAATLGKANRALYFEIRHFSEPENPAQWVSGKSALLANRIESEQMKQNTRAQLSLQPGD